jgi:hypothetical protein
MGFLTPVTTVEPRRTDPLSLRYVRSYLVMRIGIGVTAIALPLMLVFIDGWLFGENPFPRDSISAYYYSGMRDLQVGVICATGTFLLAYKVAEQNLDNTLSIVAGLAVVVSALSPPRLPPGIPPSPLQQLVGQEVTAWTHFLTAVVFIICTAVLSVCFGIREGKRPPRKGKLPPTFWRIYHWVCAGLIAAALLWMGSYELFSHWGPRQTLLIGEGLSLLAFGASWLLKGLELDMLRGMPTPQIADPELRPARAPGAQNSNEEHDPSGLPTAG